MTTPLTGIYPTNTVTHLGRNTVVFIAVLFVVNKIKKQFKCLPKRYRLSRVHLYNGILSLRMGHLYVILI